MTVYVLWNGGASYAPGYVGDDAYPMSSIRAAVEMCADRYDNRDGTTPAVSDDSSAWVWLTDPRGTVDPYPDRIITRGPRGAWKVSLA
jgi:hypothetical protein